MKEVKSQRCRLIFLQVTVLRKKNITFHNKLTEETLLDPSNAGYLESVQQQAVGQLVYQTRTCCLG
jgi:hypothetical protein